MVAALINWFGMGLMQQIGLRDRHEIKLFRANQALENMAMHGGLAIYSPGTAGKGSW